MSAEKGSPQNTLPFYPVAALRASRDLIFNPLSGFKFTSPDSLKSGSNPLRSNLLCWLSALWLQPYFAWHPLIREQDRPGAWGALRKGKSWAPIPASRPGTQCTLVPAHKMNAVFLLLFPLSLPRTPQILKPSLSSKIATGVLGITVPYVGALQKAETQNFMLASRR